MCHCEVGSGTGRRDSSGPLPNEYINQVRPYLTRSAFNFLPLFSTVRPPVSSYRYLPVPVLYRYQQDPLNSQTRLARKVGTVPGKTAQQPRRRLRWHRDRCRTMSSWRTLSHLSQCQEVARYRRDSRVVAKWITTSPPSHSKLAQPLSTYQFHQWRP